MLDAYTFSNKNVINYISENFTPFKINAEAKIGQPLFEEFKGTGYPLIIFLDQNQNELDRFYGYYPPDKFLTKLENVQNGKNTFSALLTQYKLGDQSSETMFNLANKYFDRGDNALAKQLYSQMVNHSDVSYQIFHKSKLSLGIIDLDDNYKILEKYISNYPNSPYLYEAINYLLQYFKKNNFVELELNYYNRYVDIFSSDPWFLNQYAWRMTELNKNLDIALNKINISLDLISDDDTKKAMVLDTKAEIYWKLGNKNDAVLIINEAINIEPENEYYQHQKNKFLE